MPLYQLHCLLLQPSRWLRSILRALLIGYALLISCSAIAGTQREEALSDSIRVALSNAVGDSHSPKPEFSDIRQRLGYLRWLANASLRLKRNMPDRQMRRELLQTVYYEATRAGLDPTLVLGLIQVESAFRKYAMSPVGARGYMQVMPFWTRVIGDRDPQKLFHMQTNLRYGCAILRMYLDIEKGDLYLALGRYNGSRGAAEYPNAVYSAWQRWVIENKLENKLENKPENRRENQTFVPSASHLERPMERLMENRVMDNRPQLRTKLRISQYN